MAASRGQQQTNKQTNRKRTHSCCRSAPRCPPRKRRVSQASSQRLKVKREFRTAAALPPVSGRSRRPTRDSDVQTPAVRQPAVGEGAVPGALVRTGHRIQQSHLRPREHAAVWFLPLRRRRWGKTFDPTVERGAAAQPQHNRGAGGDWFRFRRERGSFSSPLGRSLPFKPKGGGSDHRADCLPVTTKRKCCSEFPSAVQVKSPASVSFTPVISRAVRLTVAL